MAALAGLLARPLSAYICNSCRHVLLQSQAGSKLTVQRYCVGTYFSQRSPIALHREAQYFYSTSSRIPDTSGPEVAVLPDRSFITLSGPDAAKFLQGLVTNNVDPSVSSSFYSAFLDARGRVLFDVFIWAWPESFAKKDDWACIIEVDEVEAPTLMKHLKRHKLRSKITIEHMNREQEGSGGLYVWSEWGSPGQYSLKDEAILALDDPRAPGMLRYLLPRNGKVTKQGSDTSGVEGYLLQRYRLGIPEGSQEIVTGSALPMECNIDLNQGIDFKKGCYVGQELTIRTKHTGVVRKRILPVKLHNVSSIPSDLGPASPIDIRTLDEDGNILKGRPVGKFIAGQGNVGLALCRLENMTSMKVSAEGGTWKPGMEFGMEVNSEIIKVEPVLHDWFVLREREMWDKNRTRI